MKILVIIPAYDEEANIGKLLDELADTCPQYDYLVVNDCSKDGTEEILRQRGARHVSLPVNLGIGGAVQTGYLYALENGYDIAVQMDGDGQHRPEYLERLIAPVAAGETDVAVGSRFMENEGFQSSAARRLGISVLNRVIRLLTGCSILDVTSGFRAANRRAIELFASEYAQDYPEPEALVVSSVNGLLTMEVPVRMREREGGASSIQGLRSLYYMVKVTLALFVARIRERKG